MDKVKYIVVFFAALILFFSGMRLGFQKGLYFSANVAYNMHLKYEAFESQYMQGASEAFKAFAEVMLEEAWPYNDFIVEEDKGEDI